MDLLRNAIIGVILALTGFCHGQDSSSVKIVVNGHASMEAGQVVAGHDRNVGDISNVMMDRIYLGTGLNARLGNQTNFIGGIEVKAFNEFPRVVGDGFTRRYYYYFYLTQAELVHHFIDKNGLKLDVGGGYFPYKYDEYAGNLGEYIFRSTAYPQTLATEFDFPFARLAGLYAKSVYAAGVNRFTFDFLATINTEWMAIGDLNLSMIASYNFAKIFEIGAGVQFGSLLSADESATTPENGNTRYVVGNDSNNFYTFRGTKVMGRVAFDPKTLLQTKIFGDKDLVLYSEAALLGTKNYPTALNSPIWYNSPLERIPVMIGFNFPTFKLLDALSLEGEWWGNRYPNSLEGVVFDGVPIPFRPGTTQIDSTQYKNDNLKWSIFGSKIFANHYRISFQVASDHMRTFAWDWNRQDWEESLRGTDKWYYILRFGVMF